MDFLMKSTEKTNSNFISLTKLLDIKDIMRISYFSPKKNVKTFSFRNMKPVLIFTADKPKDNKKEHLILTEVKKKIVSDSANKMKDGNHKRNLNTQLINGKLNFLLNKYIQLI